MASLQELSFLNLQETTNKNQTKEYINQIFRSQSLYSLIGKNQQTQENGKLQFYFKHFPVFANGFSTESESILL